MRPPGWRGRSPPHGRPFSGRPPTLAGVPRSYPQPIESERIPRSGSQPVGAHLPGRRTCCPKPPRTRASLGLLDRELRRRDFLKFCTLAAAAVGLPLRVAEQFAEAAVLGKKPSVIWLHFQECTGCTESLLRTTTPALDELILDLISLDYHETLLVPSGKLAERRAARPRWRRTRASSSSIIEGAMPTKDGGIYCKIGGQTAIEMLRRDRREGRRDHRHRLLRLVGRHSLRRPESDRRHRHARDPQGQDRGHHPGLPGQPLQLPRHRAAVRHLRHAARARRARPAEVRLRPARSTSTARAAPTSTPAASPSQYGDEGHRQGWCLYRLGCKGPATHANCSVKHFDEVVDAWPIGLGHPCFGCTEQKLAFRVPLHDTVDIDRPTPPDTYPPIHAEQGGVSPVATGVAGVVGGAVVGAAWMAAKKLGDDEPKPKN